MAITAAQVIKALPGTGGNKTIIAQRLGCSRQHIVKLLRKYPTALAAYEQENDAVDDRIENTLLMEALGWPETKADAVTGKLTTKRTKEPNTAALIYSAKVRPGLRDKYGPEMKKLDIKLSADELKLLPAFAQAVESMGETVEEFLRYVIERAQQDAQLGPGDAD